jgi:hypothetical protein
LKNKHDLQITRLALREQIVNSHERLNALSETLATRYNLPYEPTVVGELLEQTLQSKAVLTEVLDKHLDAGLPQPVRDICHHIGY